MVKNGEICQFLDQIHHTNVHNFSPCPPPSYLKCFYHIHCNTPLCRHAKSCTKRETLDLESVTVTCVTVSLNSKVGNCIGRHIAWDDANNRVKGFDSIILQSAVMYYDIIFFAFD